LKPSCTILVSSAGRRVALIDCFRDSAEALGVDLRVVAVDLDPAMSAACQAADLALPVPRCTEPAFIERLVEICRMHAVDLVVPTIDTELENLSRHRHRFDAIRTGVSVPATDVVRMSRDKLRTARFLAGHEIPVPRSGTIEAALGHAASWRWPLIVRPRDGSSSIGVHIVTSPGQLAELRLPDTYFVQELVRGDEYTVNLFFDRSGELRCAVPHLRCEIRAGEVAKGITRRHARLERIAWTRAARCGARGGHSAFRPWSTRPARLRCSRSTAASAAATRSRTAPARCSASG
jgi:carbamoyl-phosphate synthase large subunit